MSSLGPGCVHLRSGVYGRRSWADHREHPDLVERVGQRRVGGRRQSRPLEAVARRGRRRRGPPASRRARRRRRPGAGCRTSGRGQRRLPATRSAGRAPGPPIASASQIGKFVMTGRSSSDRPAGGRERRVERRVAVANAATGRRRTASPADAPRNRSAPKIVSAGAEPGHGPRPAALRADRGDQPVEARAAPTIRAGRGPAPAAWRNVPQVVETGNSRLVTRKIAPTRARSGGSDRRRTGHGSAEQADERRAGSPGAAGPSNRLWSRPSTRISSSGAGPTAR